MMARKDVFAGLTPGQHKKAEAESYTAHGASKKMIQSIQEFAEKARSEGAIIDLDPNLIDASPFRDRLPDDDPLVFEEFKRSMSEEGQKVPIQVRPHPSMPGRYQVVYGHRRLRAAKELGLQVKATPLELSDRDLVVAQGIENGARQDLSWIERALFAKTMEDANIKPRNIKAALAISDQELARMRSVFSTIPEDVIGLIGRAPKVGRPRWMDLAKVLGSRSELLRKTLPAVTVLDSNQRFQIALDALKEKPTPKAELDVKITATTPRGKAFAKFVESRLPALIEEFQKGDN
jgi:ParB family transcriptional regulator, chromosome partitioning protein